MKRHSVRLFGTRAALLITLLAAFTSGLFAQSVQMKANIPFDFYIGGKLLPAGAYSVTPLASQNGIQISNSSGMIAMLITTPVANSNPTRSRFVFHRYGTVYFLSELQWEGYFAGHALPESKLEIEARHSSAPETAVLSATR